jgi:hypothetical protein
LDNNYSYSRDKNDCDDFAVAATVFAKFSFDKTHKIQYSILIGEFHYVRADGENHALNIVIDENREVKFYEPQGWKEIYLSENEIKSCSFWRF